VTRTLVGVGILALGGCAARRGVGGEIEGQGRQPEGYPARLAAWTQDDVLHDGFATVLRVRATLLSDEVVDAMNAEAASWQIDAVPMASPTTPTVVFSAASELDDLGFSTADKPAAWQVGLLVDGQRCTLEELTETKITALTHRLYPELSTWDRQWTARFSGCPVLGETQLQVVGAHGTLEFGWRVGGDSVVAMRRAPVRW